MRKTFSKVIVELADKDPTVVLIIGDIGFGIFDEFRARFPGRFFNLGICEQSIVGVAAGMALSGMKPYVYSITPFILERPFEQIKLDVDQQNTNVKIVGYGDYPHDGVTHQTLNQRKLSELFVNIVSYFPKNGKETREALLESYESGIPAFISLMKDNG